MAATQGKVRRLSGIAALILVITGGAWFAYAATAEPETRFCTLGLAFVQIDGETVVFQDQGSPGLDGCDDDATSRHDRTLGLDCKVRDPDGEVLRELEPNRDDGTCGLYGPDDDGFPESWGTS